MKKKSTKSMELRQPRRGRRPGNSNTREEILAAAKRLFAKEGYSGTTLRKIAANAKVDVGLVSHFFKSKDDLFFECIHIPIDVFDALGAAFEGPIHDLGERVVRAYLQFWENRETAEPMISLARSSFTHEESANILGDYSRSRLSSRFTVRIKGQSLLDAEIKREGAFSTLFSVALARYVFRFGHLAELNTDKVVAVMAPIIQQTLVANLPQKDNIKSRRGRKSIEIAAHKS